MEYDVFISYSRKDSEYAEKIYHSLEAAGVHCFIDRAGISGGADFPMVLADAIMDSKLLLLVASENAYASEFTQKELTFAVSNKGSRFIFPLIVDGSTMPKKLEFLLSDINWRQLSAHYQIENELVADIQAKLKDPHAGETLRQREQSSTRLFLVLILLLVILGGVGLAGYQYHVKKLERLEREKAEAALKAEQEAVKKDELKCRQLLDSCKLQLRSADALRARKRAFETFEEEVATLQSIDPMANRVDTIVAMYSGNYTYRQHFADFSTLHVRTQMTHKLDSMFKYWNRYAVSNYNDYRSYPNKAYRDDALDCARRALAIRPDDQNLLKIQDKLQKKKK